VPGSLAARGKQRSPCAGETEKDPRSDRKAALEALTKLAVKLDHEMSTLAFTKLPRIAREYELSVYDAAYLELAQRRKLPLVSKDAPLRQAALRAKIKVL
jgi:predicted nucleic acid-binding protein